MTTEKQKNKIETDQLELLKHIVITVVVLAIATLINYIVVFLYEKTTNVTGVFLLAIVIVSTLTGKYFWGILSSVYSMFATNYIFMYPFFAFDFSLAGYPLTLLVMATTSILTCALTVNMHNQRDKAERREKMVHLMNDMDRKLLRADSREEITKLLMEHMYIQVEHPVLYLDRVGASFIFLDDIELTEENYALVEKQSIEVNHLPDYYQIACKALETKQSVNENGVWCLPVMWQKKDFGAICIILGKDILTREIQEYAQAIINHFAIAFDHQALREIQQQILMEKQEEQLRGSLLRSISHDLRTPLTGILGASGSILENGERMQPELRKKLLRDIDEEAHWLLRMIENVLSITKIGNHNTKLNKMLEPVEEVIADSVARCKKYYPELKIEIHQPDDLIMIPMDSVLIRQVLTNLLDNAYRHGKSNQNIELSVVLNDTYVEISVQDYGPGMAAEDLQHVFRGLGRRKQQDSDGSRGLGLGVSICKTIVEAHDGQLLAENVAGKGLKVTFRLPVGERNENEWKYFSD